MLTCVAQAAQGCEMLGCCRQVLGCVQHSACASNHLEASEVGHALEE